MMRYVTILIVFFSAMMFAQNTGVKKLRELKGDVKKITVTTDKGEVVLEGKEAAKMFKKMKQKSPVVVKIETDFDDDMFCDSSLSDSNCFVMKRHPLMFGKNFPFNGNGCGKAFSFEFDDSAFAKMKRSIEDCCKMDSSLLQLQKHFKMQFPKDCRVHGSDDEDIEMYFNENGADSSVKKEKKIVIMKRFGDKTEVETYTGEEAEKKISEMEKGDGKPEKGQKKIIIKKEEIKKDKKSDTLAPTDKEGKKERNE